MLAAAPHREQRPHAEPLELGDPQHAAARPARAGDLGGAPPQQLGGEVLARRARQVARQGGGLAEARPARHRRAESALVAVVARGDLDAPQCGRRGLAAIGVVAVVPEHRALGHGLRGVRHRDLARGQRDPQITRLELARAARGQRGGLAQAHAVEIGGAAEPDQDHAPGGRAARVEQRQLERTAAEVARAHQRRDRAAAGAIHRGGQAVEARGAAALPFEQPERERAGRPGRSPRHPQAGPGPGPGPAGGGAGEHDVHRGSSEAGHGMRSAESSGRRGTAQPCGGGDPRGDGAPGREA